MSFIFYPVILSRLSFHQLNYLTHPYPPSVKEGLLQTLGEGGGAGERGVDTLRHLCTYNALIGRVFADAAKAVVVHGNVNMSNVALIGSHG